MEWIILAISGLFSGIVGALVGLGGGVILVPAILFFGATLGINTKYYTAKCCWPFCCYDDFYRTIFYAILYENENGRL